MLEKRRNGKGKEESLRSGKRGMNGWEEEEKLGRIVKWDEKKECESLWIGMRREIEKD